MAYADLNDVNNFLAADRIPMTQPDVDALQTDAQRIVRGYVGGVIDPTKLAAWDSPAHTPELIRAITGRLIAAAWIVQRYSEHNPELIPATGQKFYNEAIMYLMQIKSGEQILVEVDGTTIDTSTTQFSNTNFGPTDASTPPSFTREMIFG